MSTSQRVSRGFHRLALFLAAIPLLIGIVSSVLWGFHDANLASDKHQQLVCAQNRLGTREKPWTIPWDALVKAYESGTPLENAEVSLKRLGCSEWEYDSVRLGEALDVSPKFDWIGKFAPPSGIGFAITLVVSLALYGAVRAIGWVIGGFAAS
jgi:hypothetical protein